MRGRTRERPPLQVLSSNVRRRPSPGPIGVVCKATRPSCTKVVFGATRPRRHTPQDRGERLIIIREHGGQPAKLEAGKEVSKALNKALQPRQPDSRARGFRLQQSDAIPQDAVLGIQQVVLPLESMQVRAD